MSVPPSEPPLLTVAVPVFNRESSIGPLLASLDSQDWSLLEVRFSDDGSTDGTPGVLAAFAERHPGRVFVESHGNLGPGPCRNRLLAEARGEYIWFCDSDDELAPGAVARLAEILRDGACDLLAFEYGRGPCPADPARLAFDAPAVQVDRPRLLLSMLGATVAKAVRADLLRRHGIGFPSLRAGEDWVFTARAACVCGPARVWAGRPYWARNGFWSKTGAAHLTGSIGESFCADVTAAIGMLEGIRDANPDLRLELGFVIWNLAAHLRNRIRDDAPPEVRAVRLPEAELRLQRMAEARDNPLLRFPRAFDARDRALRKALAERDRARHGFASGREAIDRIRSSLSWRLTAPLRAIGEWVSRRNGGGGRP